MHKNYTKEDILRICEPIVNFIALNLLNRQRPILKVNGEMNIQKKTYPQCPCVKKQIKQAQTKQAQTKQAIKKTRMFKKHTKQFDQPSSIP